MKAHLVSWSAFTRSLSANNAFFLFYNGFKNIVDVLIPVTNKTVVMSKLKVKTIVIGLISNS